MEFRARSDRSREAIFGLRSADSEGMLGGGGLTLPWLVAEAKAHRGG